MGIMLGEKKIKMWKTGKTIAIVIVVSLLGGVLVLGIFRLSSRRPDNLGAQGGKLAPCPSTPNCVCSQASDEEHHIEPIAYTGSAEEAWKRLQTMLHNRPRTRVVTVNDHYLHAECWTPVFRFVDDVEFVLDPEGSVIHVRSASRVGRSDLGVNRRRVEGMRQKFAETQPEK